MTWIINFDPLINISFLVVVALIVALYAGISVLFFFKRGALLRVATFFVLILALLNPVLEWQRVEKLSNIAVIVVDRSASQDLDMRPEQTQNALEVLQQRLTEFSDIETYIVETDMKSGETIVFEELRQALERIPQERLAGIFAITDGQIHDLPSDTAILDFPGPFHGLITGRENEKDLYIMLENTPRFGLVGETITVRVKIDGFVGSPAMSQKVNSEHSNRETRQDLPNALPLTIMRDGEIVDTIDVPLGITQALNIEIPHGGLNLLQFQIETIPGELTEINNSVFLEVEGIRENLRVLLVSGKPHAGERAWRNLLKSDASVDLVHFTILRPAEKQDNTPINELALISVPTRELFIEKIKEFDLIIFDRYERLGMLSSLHFTNMTDYVASGGAILVAAGPEYAGINSLYHTPLKDILPANPTTRIIEEPFLPQISYIGQRHPVTRSLLNGQDSQPEWSRWFRLIDVTPVQLGEQTPQTIMTGQDDRPLMLLSRYGEGRVAVIMSDHIWLWTRGFEGGGPYTMLLRRLAHWLMQEPELEEEQLRAKSAESHIITIERQTMQMLSEGDENLLVDIIAPSGRIQKSVLERIRPGLYRSQISVGRPGIYRVRNGDLETLVQVGTMNLKEYRNVLSAPTTLQPVVDATQGKLVRLDLQDNVVPRLIRVRGGQNFAGKDWMGLKINDVNRIIGVHQWPLLDGLLGLTLLLGALTWTWAREAR